MTGAALLILGAGAVANPVTLLGQDPAAATRIGVIAGPMGSFAASILGSLRIGFDKVGDQTPGDSLARFDVLVIDNLFRLQDLNGPAIQKYVETGGVLVILNPKADGYSRTWTPYDLFIGDPTREAKIADRKHPLFQGFSSDRVRDLAESNGPFVGNCSLSEPARAWKVLARQAKGKNAVIVEAAFGSGWILVACTRFDHYNAKADATRLGDNLVRYAMAKSQALRGS